MTRFIYDQFSKDYLETLLSPHGFLEVAKPVSSEIREIDVWFAPDSPALPPELGLLGRFAQTPAVFEPYRNPATLKEIHDCLAKLAVIREEFHREANRQKQSFSGLHWPRLWILTPTASQTIVNGFGGKLKPDWERGVYFFADFFCTALVVIHQLPQTPETLWLRLLGRGRVQRQAISELENLDIAHPFRSITLELLYNLRRNLEVTQETVQEDRELIMRLAPLYQQDRQLAVQEGIEQGIERGIQQGEGNLVIRLLNRRIGSISDNLSEQIRQLSVTQLEALGLALLEFESETDLVHWLDRSNGS